MTLPETQDRLLLLLHKIHHSMQMFDVTPLSEASKMPDYSVYIEKVFRHGLFKL